MVFVPGAMHPSEIESPVDVAAAVRWLASQQMTESLRFARLFMEFTRDSLGVPPVAADQSLFYLNKFCLADSFPGVYHRNLALLRHSPFPVILIEPLLQNNRQEFEALTKQDLKLGTFTGNRRLWEVAQTCAWTIEAYRNQKKPIYVPGP